MAAPCGLDNDWAYLPGSEPVTLFRRTGGDAFDAGVLIPHAVRVTSTRGQSGDPRVTARHLAWLVSPAEAAPSGQADPRSGDKLVDAQGVTWRIGEVKSYPLESTHRLETVQVR